MYRKKGWSKGWLWAVAGAVAMVLLWMVSFANPKGEVSDDIAQTFRFSYRPLKEFLPKGWKLASALGYGKSQKLVEGVKWKEGVYELRFVGPGDRNVSQMVGWDSEGIHPRPDPSLFEVDIPKSMVGPEKLVEKVVKQKREEKKNENKIIIPDPKIQTRSHWKWDCSGKMNRGWSGGQALIWGRRMVLMASQTEGQLARLQLDLHDDAKDDRGSLRVTEGAFFSLAIFIKGGDRLRIQVYSKRLKSVFYTTVEVEDESWNIRQIACDQFRTLDGKMRLRPGHLIDNLALFLEQEGDATQKDMDRWERWLGLSKMAFYARSKDLSRIK